MFNINDVMFFILAAVALITAIFIFYGKNIKPGAISAEKMERARRLALDVVTFIEQTLPGSTPKDKKLQARDKLKRLLDAVNIKASEEILDILIEAAVFTMNAQILEKDKGVIRSEIEIIE